MIRIPRIHFFEFDELRYLPNFLRWGITELLGFATTYFVSYSAIIPLLIKTLNHSNENRIIDLCSGSGGAIKKINKLLKKHYKKEFTITLTDKYPNFKAFKHIARTSEGNINYIGTPVDATDVRESLKGVRTLFISFHHFKPEKAKQILLNAKENNCPIAIFEITNRSILQILGNMFLPLTAYAFAPFIRPFRISRFIFTYAIPLIPFLYFWDGLISVLRTYSPDELEKMAEINLKNHYVWEMGRIKKNLFSSINYLIGYPEQLSVISKQLSVGSDLVNSL